MTKVLGSVKVFYKTGFFLVGYPQKQFLRQGLSIIIGEMIPGNTSRTVRGDSQLNMYYQASFHPGR